MTYYVGTTPQDIISSLNGARYFYGLRRTDDGDLYFVRIDQVLGNDSIEINNPGDPEENFEDFELGVDFYDGRDEDHNLVYENLNYEQYRWDDRSIYYYIDDDGQLVARINAGYTYPTGV